ncbi:MAG: GIY-YIG nuclease family protein [Planctomycetes bacterium]|nr:GIY-YIG nuclease family protein [Planctomycetota bacterium]MCG2682256.1 GIY-YIG nuclease family protein [Planctomycetales bacterium]
MKRLIDIGFRKVGEWNLTQSGIEYSLHDCADARNILYCFVCEQAVLYVGKTVQSLKKRMYGYQNPGPTQSTNIKGNKNICSLLADGKQVNIFALPDNGLLHFGGFHINLAAGLEDSIVKTLNPSWNKTGTANN